LRVEGSEAGQGEVTLQTEMEGQPIDILFNIQYLLEGVQHITEQDCQLQLSGPQDPAIFRPLAADNHYLYVVMPIQL
jgi:DNA polymerase-3 subunit beta